LTEAGTVVAEPPGERRTILGWNSYDSQKQRYHQGLNSITINGIGFAICISTAAAAAIINLLMNRVISRNWRPFLCQAAEMWICVEGACGKKFSSCSTPRQLLLLLLPLLMQLIILLPARRLTHVDSGTG
jgi:hypothetical protein